MISDIALPSLEVPELPFIAVVYTPPDALPTGPPLLRVCDPRGIVYDYIYGFGLMALHSQAGCEGQFLVDLPGEWSWEWIGFDSRMPLRGELEVLSKGSNGVVR